ncbi:hypothetical protein Q3G72_008935 [Acer saccharum]|nr:hypothetical protein Q3G72_008935 [Acer saccharum]
MNHSRQLKDTVFKLEARGMKAAEMHGDLGKLGRSTTLKKFKNGRGELPVFNFDAEKNRYLPIKGLIPGTSRSPSTAQNSNAKQTQAINSHGTRARTSKLLLVRELSGNVLSLRKGNCNFKEEFQKRLVSQPTVWKYRTENIGDSALEQIRMDVITPEGEYETDFLLTGSVKGYLSVFEVGNVGQEIYNEEKCIPEQVWPPIKENKEESYKAPDLRLKRDGPAIKMSSTVSCIKSTANVSTDSYFNLRRALYPFMISDFIDSTLFTINVSCISYFVNTIDNPEEIYVLSKVNPLAYSRPSITRLRMQQIASFNCNIWTADYNPNTNQAVIGTGLGAALVNLDKGTQSWVFHCKSDVLALQLHPSMGNVVLCGLRNGAIVTADIRERPEAVSNRLITHQIPYSPSRRIGQNSKKHWFKLEGNVSPSHTVFMPSAISSLRSLHVSDQYFLASTMDGSVKLYDHRIINRGHVQSYEGHVNSRTRIQLGVDQSERFVMSGGEDNNLRIWSIKSGELLFDDKFSNSIPHNVRWWRPERKFVGTQDGRQSDEDYSQFGQSYSSNAWIQTCKEIFHMHWY